MRHRLRAPPSVERMDTENFRVVNHLLELLLERRGTDEVRVVMRRIASRDLTPESAIRLLEALDERDSLDIQTH